MQRMFVQYTRRTTRKLCKMFLFFFSIKIITMEAKQEENKIPTKCMQKVHKMFVNVHKQSTHVLKNLSILF